MHRKVILFSLSCFLMLAAAPAMGEDSFGILVEQSRNADESFIYDFGFLCLCKDVSTSCAITIGDDTYTCSQWADGGWYPDPPFWVE
ncbi:MAG: hypothetical protein ABIF77_07085, partial [bacterium]